MARRRRKATRRRGRRGGLRRFRAMPGFGGIVRDLQAAGPKVGWGLVGYTGTSFLPTVAARFIPLPTKDDNPMGYWFTKLLMASVTGFTVRQFAGRSAGQAAVVGALLTMGAEVVNQMIFPMMGLADYLPEDNGIAAYLPENAGMGYANPGEVIGDYEYGTVPRLNPDLRI